MRTSRRTFIAGATATAFIPGIARTAPVPVGRRLWYRQPAERWLQALPIGNGRLGGMLFGGIGQERIHLSESTIWSGAPPRQSVDPNARTHIGPIRELMFAGRFDEADALCEKHLLGREEQFGTALPLGFLDIDLGHDGAVDDYSRWLDLAQAIAGVEYRVKGVAYRREAFASHPDGIIALHFSGGAGARFGARIRIAPPHLPGTASTLRSDTLLFEGQALETVHSDGKHGVRVAAAVRAIVEGGRLTATAGEIAVETATSLTLLVGIATDMSHADPATAAQAPVEAAAAKGYRRLRADHVADHKALFDRASLSLGGAAAAALPTDKRRQRLAAGTPDPDLAALFFDFGRYLTIAGSRPDSPLPLALQGIWNDGRAAAMGWSNDFHLDINTQQNYWACEVANLSECHASLWPFLDRLSRHGGATARTLYGARGWVAHVVSNPWGFTAPGWGNGWGIFVGGGLWLALDLWDHFQFREDRTFLRETAWPVLRGAVDFFLDYLAEHPKTGQLVTGPSISPENAFKSPATGRAISNSMGPTCDLVLVRQLFSACIEASALLGIEPALRTRLEAARDRLPPLRVGRDGRLQEWLEDVEDAQPSHRHTSHLIALYPYAQIDPQRTPDLAKAASTTIARRLAQSDWEDTEWSRANFIAYHARLRDGDEAERHLRGLITGDADDGLLTYSRGGIAGATEDIFAVDGNMAGTAAVAEMLLQSHRGEIALLPALPTVWDAGEVRGLKARGDVTVTIGWSGGRPRHVELTATRAGVRRISFGDRTIEVHLPAGRPVALGPDQIGALII
jgi:alpha-L-fucosidase 2